MYTAKLYVAANKYDKALLALRQLIICNEKLLEYTPNKTVTGQWLATTRKS